MKLPSSAIALTLMFGTILVNAPMQSVAAEHNPAKDKQSFDNRPERERVRKKQVCQVQPCEYPIPFALPQLEMSGKLNETLHFLNNFHTNFELPKKEVFNQTVITELHSLLEAVKNPKFLPPSSYQPKPGSKIPYPPFKVIP